MHDCNPWRRQSLLSEDGLTITATSNYAMAPFERRRCMFSFPLPVAPTWSGKLSRQTRTARFSSVPQRQRRQARNIQVSQQPLSLDVLCIKSKLYMGGPSRDWSATSRRRPRELVGLLLEGACSMWNRTLLGPWPWSFLRIIRPLLAEIGSCLYLEADSSK